MSNESTPDLTQSYLFPCSNEVKPTSESGAPPVSLGAIPAIHKPKGGRSNVIHLQANGSLAGLGLGMGAPRPDQPSAAVNLASLPIAAATAGDQGMRGGEGGMPSGDRLSPQSKKLLAAELDLQRAQVRLTIHHGATFSL